MSTELITNTDTMPNQCPECLAAPGRRCTYRLPGEDRGVPVQFVHSVRVAEAEGRRLPDRLTTAELRPGIWVWSETSVYERQLLIITSTPERITLAWDKDFDQPVYRLTAVNAIFDHAPEVEIRGAHSKLWQIVPASTLQEVA